MLKTAQKNMGVLKGFKIGFFGHFGCLSKRRRNSKDKSLARGPGQRERQMGNGLFFSGAEILELGKGRGTVVLCRAAPEEEDKVDS